MNRSLLHKEVQAFIRSNEGTDLQTLVLKGSPFPGIESKELAEQIQSRSKCKAKLPTWFQTEGIYYPKKIHVEQSSSEITASYKAGLVTGSELIDLTGGMGVDSFYFSKKVAQVTHCEVDRELHEIAEHNFKALGACNVHCHHVEGIQWLQEQSRSASWLYVDPSRRDTKKGKVFLLEDCQPDVTRHQELLFGSADNLLLKLSPMMDIQAACRQLRFIRQIHVVAVDNEVKELLLLLNKGYEGKIQVHTINFTKNGVERFEAPQSANVRSSYSDPLKYLYEPNAAILKAGFFNEVSDQLNVYKLHDNSHLYTSNDLIEFPGRRFLVQAHGKYDPKRLRREYPLAKANITTRNFRESVAAIRKRSGIAEGGDDYLFFTTGPDNRALVIHCKKAG